MQFASGTRPPAYTHSHYNHAASCSWRYRWSLADDQEIRRCLRATAAARSRSLARPQGRHPRSRPGGLPSSSSLLPP